MKNNGSALQIWTDNNPQGFSFRQSGVKERSFTEIEGLFLIQKFDMHKAINIPEHADENADPEMD